MVDYCKTTGLSVSRRSHKEAVAPPFAHHYPSNYNLGNIIAVVATDHNDQMAYFSNFGIKTVDLGGDWGRNLEHTSGQ